MGAELFRKYVSSSIIVCYRSVVRHPFLVSMIIILYSMYRLFPLLFSLLVSASPVIVSTAVLLGTLLSFGHPNIPELEKEPESGRDEIRKLESKVISRTEVVGRDVSFASEETNGSRIEVADKSFEEKTKIDDGSSCVEADTSVNLVDDGVLQFGEAKYEKDQENVVLGSHYSPLQQSEDEHIVLESDDKLWEGSADPLNSNAGLLWKRMEGDDDDDDGNDDDDDDDDDDESDSGDSGSDLAESSSPDASMADIIPMLDELHPLLSEEHETHEPPHISRHGTEAVSEHSLESSDTSSESNDDSGIENHENFQIEGDEDEDKEPTHVDKEDEARSAITWTEDDQKNLMNLGTSEMERNRRLENLIARRRVRKTMRLQAEKNLIDLESGDLPWNIPPISTSRNNPFDYDSNDNIPGSAPSVLLQRRNPFDLPYDSSEEKPDLVGDTFQQEFAVSQPKEPFFRRFESFNVGPSVFGASRSERQETKLRPYFVPERSFATFQRQFSGLSDSKASSVPDTESVSSASDLETKDHVEENDQSLEAEFVSGNDPEHASETREYPELVFESEHVSDHGRPYFIPEQAASGETSFSTFQRQISEVSDSKVSSVPDTDSVSSASDLENKDHIEDNEQSAEAEFVSEKDHEYASETREYPELASESEHDHGRPYFLPEHVASKETRFSTFQRQISEVSDSKVSSVPDTDSVSSASDLENKAHIEDNEHSLEAELASEKDHEHDSDKGEHPELIYERQRLSDHTSHGSEPLEHDVNVESVQALNENEGIVEAETSVGGVTNQQETENVVGVHFNLGDEESHSSGSSLSSSDEASEQIYNEKEVDEVATPVSEANYYFVERGNSIERSDIEITSLLVEDSQPKEPVYDTSPRAVTRNLSSSSIINDLQADTSVEGGHLHTDEGLQPTEDQHHSLGYVAKVEQNSADSSSETRDAQNLLVNVPDNEEPLLAGDSISTFLPNRSDLEADNVVLDTDASHQSEQVQAPSLDSYAKSLEGIHGEEIISQSEETLLGRLVDKPLVEDPKGLQGHELEQGEVASSSEAQSEVVNEEETHENPGFILEEAVSEQQKEFPMSDISVSKPSEENPQVLQVQIASKHAENLQIQEPENNVSLNITSLSSAEPDTFEVSNIETKAPGSPYASGTHIIESHNAPDNSDDVDEIKEIDENILVELDAVGDFSVNDLGSTSIEMQEDLHSLEHDLDTKQNADEDSYSDDLRSILNKVKQEPHVLDHDLETNRAVDKDTDSKDLGSTINEMEQEHDIETKCSGDDSDSKDVGSTLDEMKQSPHSLEHGLQTKRSVDDDSDSKDVASTLNDIEQDPRTLNHNLEANPTVDKDSVSKDLGSRLDEMKQDPHSLERELETKSPGDEDSYSMDLGSTLVEKQQESHASEHNLETKLPGDEDSKSMDLGSTLVEKQQESHASEHDLETKLSGDKDSNSMDLESTLSETRQYSQAMENRLETFYSVDENFYSKHVESTLNEMKKVQRALDQDLETNPSGEEDSYSTDPFESKIKKDAEAVKSQNKKDNSNSEVEGASEAETSKTKLTSDASEVVLPKEIEPRSSSTSDTLVNNRTENASTTSNT